MIIGPVGSGKTSLLLGLLGELRTKKGFIRLGSERIGYCSQSAWLPNGTIKQIIAGTDGDLDDIDEEWLRTVIHACVFDIDISLMPQGEDSLIGSRGLTLSGGQRQRLALARAVYQRPSLLLLDDIFSALDAKTETLIFERLFSRTGLFRQQATTVVLATHSVHHVHSADHIIALGLKGNIVEQGTFAELDSSNGYMKSLAIAAAKNEQHQRPNVENDEENLNRGPAIAVPARHSDLGDDARRLGDFAVWNYYRKALTMWRLLSFVSLEAVCVPPLRFIQILVGWWSAANGRHTDLFISIAFLLPLVSFISQMGYLQIILIRMGPLASRRLHWTLIRIVFAAPLAFFTDVDSGIILNRFSQDMSVIDYQLPVAILQTVHNIFEVLWSLGVMCYGSYYLVASVPFLVGVVYTIQKFYLRTSRQIRILDLELQSPLLLAGRSRARLFGVILNALYFRFKAHTSFLPSLDY